MANSELALLKEFPESSYRAISNDSRQICLLRTKNPIGKFTIGPNRGGTPINNTSDSFVISVLDFESWGKVFEGEIIGQFPLSFSFFPMVTDYLRTVLGQLAAWRCRQ